MVDLRNIIPLGSISGRNIFLFAASMLVAIFALFFAISPTAHAADATWQGSAINYGGKQYIKVADATDADPRGFPKGTPIYAYVEPAPAGSATTTQKAHLLYFPTGTDPPAATSATYITYDYTPPNTYANPSPTVLVTLDPQASASTEGTTSCALEGIGWVICPVSNFLAGAMDKIFEVLASFMTVRPVQTSQDSALFRMWSVMRNFANVAFVIAFLVIIYSQVTGVGISAYGIKRLLPRIIAAAILVNISYWICAVAIDVSNISGYSLQQLFINLRNVLVGGGGNNWDLNNWTSWTSFILSGGTAGIAAGIGAQALLAGTVTGSIMLLIPILVIVLTSALVALLVMALRQAFITILVITAPLAFVAYLLPNTEKYFEKWRDLFMTMLLMFPIISVIFGGAQLAGMAIIQNANSINLVILGMAVQVAPLIITPLLIKFSGALLTRFAGVLNNPNKGLIDRSRNWAKDRAENQKAHVLASKPKAGWRGAATRRSQNIDSKRRDREGWRAANQATADANWANSKAYSDIEQASQQATLLKTRGEAAAQARFEGAKSTNAALQHLDVEGRAAKLQLELNQAKGEANWEELRAGSQKNLLPLSDTDIATRGIANYGAYRSNMVDAIKNSTTSVGVEKRRAHSAEHVRQDAFTEQMLKDDKMRETAGGIDPHGADSALAAAVTETRTSFGKSVDEAKHVLKHFNVGSKQREELLKGETIIGKNDDGVEREFNLKDAFATDAAVEMQMKEGSFEQKQAIIAESGEGGKLYAHRTTIGDEAAANRIGEQAAYFGGSVINRIKQGEIKGDEGIDEAIAFSIATDKLRAEHFATMDHVAVKRVFDVAQNNNPPGLEGDNLTNFRDNVKKLGDLANQALTNRNLSGRVAGNSREHLENIRRLWPPAPDSDNGSNDGS